jgi:hypothetical protein
LGLQQDSRSDMCLENQRQHCALMDFTTFCIGK